MRLVLSKYSEEGRAMNNPLQIVLVVETSGIDKTDAIYINAVLDKYYDTEGVNIAYEFLKGKHNYKSQKIVGTINTRVKAFKSYGGVTVIIYFVDTDSVNPSYEDNSFFANLYKFTKEKGFELVWFCKNVENVFLEVEPESLHSKTESAKNFDRSGKIDELPIEKFQKEKVTIYCSNIMKVLDKYLPRKKAE